MITTEVFMDIHSLRKDGWSMRAIAKKLGIHRDTVKKHLEAETLPQYRKRKPRASLLDPFKQIITDFLDQDDYQATWILDRIRAMGYTGSYETVRDFVRPLKEQFTERMKRKIDSTVGLVLYEMRLTTAEPPFSHIRHIMGLDRFSHRGKRKVNTQWNLFCILVSMLCRFYQQACRIVFKWLNRRSQRKSCNWQEFSDMLEFFKIPHPRIIGYWE